MHKIAAAIVFTVLCSVAPIGLIGQIAHAVTFTYPDKPVNIIVPFAPAGPTDVAARNLQNPLKKALGQTVLIENLGGAGGTIGTRKTAQAKPDGYNILLMNIGISTAPSLYKNLGFNPQTDLIPIGNIVDVPMVIVTRQDLGPKNLEELKTWLKNNAQKANIGNAGTGSASHLCGIMLQQDLGVKLMEVPYKSTALALGDLVGGQIDLVCDQLSSASGLIKGDKIKPISTTAKVPNFPTLPQYLTINVWHGLFVPKGTPDAIVKKLTAALQQAVTSAEFKEKVAVFNGIPATTAQATPKSMGERLASETTKWGKLIATAGVEKQ